MALRACPVYNPWRGAEAALRRGRDCEIDDLGDLAARRVGAPAEGAVAVAAGDAVMVRGLDEWVERVAGRHVAEVRPAARIDRPAQRADDDFAQLATRHVGAPAEGAVAIAADD